MKIVKLIKRDNFSYFALFDKLPAITYEKIGNDYIGSSFNEDGVMVQSRFLKMGMLRNAFGGRTLFLPMKDGTEQSIKHFWMDRGSYPAHGDFINIGAEELDGMTKFFGFYDFNINRQLFEGMVAEYLATDRLYEVKEVRDWANAYVRGEVTYD